MSLDPNSLNPEPPYVHTIGRISDRRIGVIDRLRAEAVQRLRLQPGNRVIDALLLFAAHEILTSERTLDHQIS